MKSFTTAYKHHLEQSATTLATIVKIVRKDGTSYRYTDYNSIITFGGEDYLPNNGFIPTNFQSASNLAVDNLDITGILAEAEDINESDIHKEFFYNAQIWVSIVNYNDPDSGQNKILYGSLGELTLNETSYTVEFRNLTYKLTRKLTNVFSKTCRAEFGDSNCGIDIEPATWQTNTYYCIGKYVSASVFDGRLYRCIVAGTSNNIEEPTWDTTIGNITTETSGVQWETEDSLVKQNNVIAPLDYRIYINSASDLRIDEFKLFNSSNTRLFPDSCSSSAYSCTGISDNSTGYWGSGTLETDEWVSIHYNSAPLLDHIEITLVSGSSIESFELQYSVDGGTTWLPFYSFTGGSSAYWSANSYTLTIPSVSYSSRTTFNIPTDIFTDMDYVVNGVITWTSGNNDTLSMEIVDYDSTNNYIKLFNPMPYEIGMSDSFIITAGCNHLFLGPDGTVTTGHCVTRYNNGNNFRGEPYVPTEDVLVGGIGETNKEGYAE